MTENWAWRYVTILTTDSYHHGAGRLRRDKLYVIVLPPAGSSRNRRRLSQQIVIVAARVGDPDDWQSQTESLLGARGQRKSIARFWFHHYKLRNNRNARIWGPVPIDPQTISTGVRLIP